MIARLSISPPQQKVALHENCTELQFTLTSSVAKDFWIKVQFDSECFRRYISVELVYLSRVILIMIDNDCKVVSISPPQQKVALHENCTELQFTLTTSVAKDFWIKVQFDSECFRRYISAELVYLSRVILIMIDNDCKVVSISPPQQKDFVSVE